MQNRIALIRQGELFNADRLNEIIKAVNASILEQPQYEKMMNDIVELANNYTSKIDAFLLRYGSIIDTLPSLIEILKAIEALQPKEEAASAIDSYIASSINLDFVYNPNEIEGIDKGCFLFNERDNTIDTSNVLIASGKCIIAQEMGVLKGYDDNNKPIYEAGAKHVFINTAVKSLGDIAPPRWLALDIIVGPQGQIGPQGAIGPKGNDGADGKDGMLVTLMGSIEQTPDEEENEDEAEAEKSMLNRLEAKMFSDLIAANYKFFLDDITPVSLSVSQSTNDEYPYVITYKHIVGGNTVEDTYPIHKDIIYGYFNDENIFIEGFASKATGYGYVYKSDKDKTNIYVFSKDVTEIQSNCGKARWVVLPSIQGPQGPQGPTAFLGVHGNYNPDPDFNKKGIKDWDDTKHIGNPNTSNDEVDDGYTHIAIRVGDGTYVNYRIQAREIRYNFNLTWTNDEEKTSVFKAPVLRNTYNTYKTYETELQLKDYITLDKNSLKLIDKKLTIDGVWANCKGPLGEKIRTKSPLAELDLSGLFESELNAESTNALRNDVAYAKFSAIETDINSKYETISDRFDEVDNTTDALGTQISELAGAISDVAGQMCTVKASASNDGLMSKEDKAKLDGIAAEANKYVHPTGKGNEHIPSVSSSDYGKILRVNALGNAEFQKIDYRIGVINPKSKTPIEYAQETNYGVAFSYDSDSDGTLDYKTINIGMQNKLWEFMDSNNLLTFALCLLSTNESLGNGTVLVPIVFGKSYYSEKIHHDVVPAHSTIEVSGEALFEVYLCSDVRTTNTTNEQTYTCELTIKKLRDNKYRYVTIVPFELH